MVFAQCEKQTPSFRIWTQVALSCKSMMKNSSSVNSSYGKLFVAKLEFAHCFCSRKNFVSLVRKLFRPLWLSQIFTQWGWRIPFGTGDFPGQIEFGESSPNFLFLKILRAGRTYFCPLSSWRQSYNIMREAI